MRYVLNIKYTWIVCLKPGRGIDRHAIGTQSLQHTVYRYRGPVWVDDIDHVWIIIAAPFGSHSTWHRSLSRTVMIPSGIYR